jgi:integrase
MQEGVNIKALQENLGHHSPAFTLEIYGHASIQMKKEAAEKIGNIIKKCTSGE